jgi:NAD(P)-dependent dehydrogenase (short-subunit alcohol dehydrogenase family)
MDVRFDDRVAIVTGSGAGLGRQHALLLASRGAKVVVNDPGGSVDGTGGANAAADAVVAQIKAAGGEAVASYASVAEEAAARSIIDTAMNTWGRLDILVNNAGISGSATNDMLDSGLWERVMAVNSTGVFLGTAAAVRQMQRNGGGSIVNLSSISGVVGQTFVHMSYNAAKGAVRIMTKSTAVQFGKDRIRCNSIHPGLMPPMRTSGATADPVVRERMLKAVPLGRAGEVDEVANAILFLASDEASYITGAELYVDGGYLAS